MAARPKILFVCEKWAECDPAHGLSNAHHNYIGSFRASGVGDDAAFFFDEHAWRTRERCDDALLDACRATRPDIVFVTPVRGSDLTPLPETLARARAETGARIIVLNGDTCDEAGVQWCERFAPVSDTVIVLDCYSLYPSRVRDPGKYLALWTPQDPALFHRGVAAPNIDVSFLGSVARYPDRKRALGLLAASGVEVAQGGGQAEQPLSIDGYADTLRRSKIVLNFARTVFDAPVFQCKGRVIEATLSGALLFEQRNPETDRWLTAGVHYVAFADERDLVDKVRTYLAHDGARTAIAAAGAAHAERALSAAAFWRRAVESVLPATVPA
jgi:hypothetical protein